MKPIVIGVLCALAFAAAADARGHHAPNPHRLDVVQTYDGDYYTNVSGHRVHRPMLAPARPSGASAQCADGSYSFSEHHRGTCSHHGGVSQWY